MEAIPSYKDLERKLHFQHQILTPFETSGGVSLQIHLVRQRNSNPNMYIMMLSKLSFPTSQQINHSSRHDLLNSEKTQNHSPQVSSNMTIKKQVIHIFSTFLTRAIPIHNYYSILLLIANLYHCSS